MTLRVFQHLMIFLTVVSLCCSASLSSSLMADEAEVRAAIEQTYSQADRARTVDQFSSLLVACDEALQKEPTAEQTSYLGELKAWLYNKRGEACSDAAIAAMEEGADAETIDQLDEQALADFQQAVDLNGDGWRAVHNRGVSFAMTHRFDEAVADFRRTIELHPNYANAHSNLGEVYYHLGENEKAIAAYTQAITLRANDVPSRSARGHVYLRQGMFERALADYSEAIRLSPADPVALTSRADAYSLMGRWKDAADDLQAAIAADDQFGWAYCRIAWLMATCPDETYRSSQHSLPAAERAIELNDGDDYRYLDTLAAAQARHGDYQAAGETIARAIEVAPEDQRADLQARQELYSQEKPYIDGR